jgi:serine protease Do
VELRQLIQGVQEGVVVRSIYTNGPAAKSELKPSDIITAVDGQAVTTPQQFRTIIRGKKIGVPITFDVFRAGRTIPIQVRPIEWPEQAPAVAVSKSVAQPKADRVELGMTVKPLTPALALQLGAGLAEGVVVATVEKNSLAARNRIRPGDIVTSVNQQPVGTRKQFETAVDKADLKKGVLLNLISGSTARFEILKAD